MATVNTDVDIQTYATPWIDPLPEAPIVVQIHMTHQLNRQLRTPEEGNVETDHPTLTAPDFMDYFTVPLPALASFASFDRYVVSRLFHMGFHPSLCNFMRQHIIGCYFDRAFRFGKSDDHNGIQIVAMLKVTTTVEFDSAQVMQELMASLLAESGGFERRRRRRGASKAAIDGLKKVVVFFNGGSGGDDEECSRTCAVCLEEFSEGTEVTCMPCSHVFHHRCIVPWLEANNSCPMCRCEVPDQ